MRLFAKGLQASSLARLALLGSLYFAQGLPFGFFTQALPVLMRHQGYSLRSIGLSSLLSVPWAVKFLWAPWVERHFWARFGRRRSWIVPLQVAATLVLALVAVFGRNLSLPQVMVLVFVLNLVAATQDIATDGLAIDTLKPEERGLGNGVQVAGYRVGMVVGGSLMLSVHYYAGAPVTFGAMALVMAAITIPILFHEESPTPRLPSAPPREPAINPWPALAEFAKQPGIVWALLLVSTYKAGDAFATSMLRAFLTDRGVSLPELGRILGVVGFSAGLVGALLGGWLLRFTSRKSALLLFGLLQALTVALYAVVAWRSDPEQSSVGWVFDATTSFYVVSMLEHLASGMATAALFTCMMDWSRGTHAATDYTVLASTVVLASGLASAVAGFSAQALGYTAHFALATAIAAASSVLTVWCFRKIDRARLGVVAGAPSAESKEVL